MEQIYLNIIRMIIRIIFIFQYNNSVILIYKTMFYLFEIVLTFSMV